MMGPVGGSSANGYLQSGSFLIVFVSLQVTVACENMEGYKF